MEKKHYRLPTEAEREYACRAGSNAAYSFGSDAQKISAYAWTATNSGGMPHPVGTRIANDWGLFDMHGNVLEYCKDHFDPNYYGISPVADPEAQRGVGTSRVQRGASWQTKEAGDARSAARSWTTSTIATNSYGFRVVCEIEN
jgi:formylglycine-generating enzyme required for sulfatase activity